MLRHLVKRHTMMVVAAARKMIAKSSISLPPPLLPLSNRTYATISSRSCGTSTRDVTRYTTGAHQFRLAHKKGTPSKAYEEDVVWYSAGFLAALMAANAFVIWLEANDPKSGYWRNLASLHNAVEKNKSASTDASKERIR